MEGSSLKFQSFTKNIQKVNDEDIHAEEFLVVPNVYFGSYGQISLDLIIRRCDGYPANVQRRTRANAQSISTNIQRSTGANTQRSTGGV